MDVSIIYLDKTMAVSQPGPLIAVNLFRFSAVYFKLFLFLHRNDIISCTSGWLQLLEVLFPG